MCLSFFCLKSVKYLLNKLFLYRIEYNITLFKFMANDKGKSMTPSGPGAGGIELPSSSFVDTICGALGVLTFGDGSINNESKLLASLSKPNIIHADLTNISKAIIKDPVSNFGGKLSDIKGDTFISKLKNIIEGPNQNSDLLTEYMTYFSSTYNDNICKLVENVESIAQKLSSISKQEGSDDSKSKDEILSEIILKLEADGKGGKDLVKSLEAFKNFDPKDLTNICQTLNDSAALLNNEQIKGFNHSIEALTEIFTNISNLGSKLNKKKQEEIKERVKEIEPILNGSIKKLFDTLNKMVSKQQVAQIDQSCVTLSELLSSLLSVISMDQSKVSDKGVRLLLKLVEPNGTIDKLFENIIRFDKKGISNDAVKSISSIFGVVGKFNDLGKIGFFAAINVRRGLRILKSFIENDLESIFNVIKTLNAEVKDQKDAIDAIKGLIDLIANIAEVNCDWNDVRAKIGNISYLLEFDLIEMIKSFSNAGDMAGDNVDKAKTIIDGVGEIVKIVKELGEIKNSDIEKAALKIYDLGYLFNDDPNDAGEIFELLTAVSSSKLVAQCENVKTNIDTLNEVFSTITDLFGKLPGVLSVFKTQFKVDLMVTVFESINDMFVGNKPENITGINNIMINQMAIRRVIDSCNTIADFIKDINEKLDENDLTSNIDKNRVIISLLNLIEYEFQIFNSLSDFNKDKLNQIEEFVLTFSPNGQIGTSLLMLDGELADKGKDLLDIIYNISVALIYTEQLVKIDVEDKLKDIEEFVLYFAPEGQIGMALQMLDRETNEQIKELFDIVKNLSIALLYTTELSKAKINTKTLETIATDVVPQLNEILIGFSSLSGDEKTIKDNASKIVAVTDVFKALADASKYGKMAKGGLKILEKEVEMIQTIISKFNDIDEKGIESAVKTVQAFTKLLIVSAAVLIVGALAMTLIDAGNLVTFALTLGGFMFLISKAISNVANQIGNCIDTINDFSMLIVASAAVLILGGLAMKIINIGDLILFGVTLAGFIWLMVLPFKWFAETQDSVFGALQDFTKFIIASAAVLILGSLVMKVVEASDLMIFGGVLFGFVTLMCLPFWLFNKFGKDAMRGMKDFTIFVVATAAVLILGSLVMSVVDAEDLLIFTGTLFGFVLALSIPFLLFNLFGKGVMRGMKDFTIFVVASAAVLLLGSMLMPLVDTGNLILFGSVLLAFVTALSLPFFLFNKSGKGAMRGMKDFTIFVVASAAVLLLGSMLMDFIDPLNLVAFTTVLASFIWAVTAAFNNNSKNIKKAMPTIIAMMVCVVLSAAVLLIGASVMEDAGIMNTIMFATILGTFIYAMIQVLKVVNKAKKDVLMGVVVLGALMVVCGLAAGVLMLAGKVMKENDLGSLLLGTGLIALIVIGIAGIAMGLGAIITSGVGGAILWAGIGAMAAIVGVALMAGMALLAISQAMLTMKKIGKINIGDLTANITGFLGIAAALAPIGLMAPIIIAASIAVMTMTTMMSMIAQAVKDYAELKIPIYEGTKIAGYRQLESKDFETAAENVKAIITTLGRAVIDVYEENPEIFTSGKFVTVTNSLEKLGPLISKIAEGVKDYAELKVPIYKGTEISTYRQLSKKDFDSASQNVKTIIVTLSQALIDVYEENPRMFKDGSDSPFEVVMKSTGKLGKLISKIADGVKDYADLKIATGWDKEGKANEFRSLSKTDFTNAANNIKSIITTLANAVISVYETDPSLFDDGDDSIFNIVTDSCMKLGKMMSKIAWGVQSYANLTVPIKWNNEGDAIDFRSMDPSEIILAGENVKKIITTLANAVVEVYNQNPQLFDDGDKSTFNVVLKSCTNLGKMMQKIVKGVQSYANLLVPIEWNKDGMPVKFEKMKDDAVVMAGNNVKTVITTLAKAVVEVYNQNPQLFDNGDKSTFNIVMKSCTNLGKMMSGIAKGLQSYANLKFATDWDKDGKPIKFDQFKDQDVVNAGENIKKVIIALASAIVQTYHMDPSLFADPKKGDNIFNKVMASVTNLGKLMSDIAKGVQSYANLQYPIEWNAEGKPIKFERLKDQDVVNAGKNISKVITTMAKAIIETYNNNPDMFEQPKGEGFGGGSSKFDMVMKSVNGLGKLMTEISKGVQSYANLQYAIAWDKDGKPIKYQKMTDSDILKAGENIGKIIVTMSKAIINTYDLNPEMFAQPDEKGLFGLPMGKGTSKFDLVMKSVSGLGKIMSKISEGVQSYANLKYAIEWNNEGQPTKYQTMSASDIVKAGENIGKIIVTMSKAIVDTYDLNPEMFAQPDEKGLFGLPMGKGTSKFDLVMKSVSGLGKVMAKISEGVQSYANLVYPIEWNNEGQATKFKNMSSSDIVKAGENISAVILTMSKAIIDTYDLNPEMFAQPTEGIFGTKGTSKFDLVMKSVSGLGKLMGKICEGVQSYANLQYPIEWNQDGQAIKFKSMTDADVLKAGENIGKVIVTMSKAIVDTYDLNPEMFAQPTEGIFGKKGTSKFDLVMKSVGGLGKLMAKICEGVQAYANLQYPIEWNKDGQAIKFKGMTDSDVLKAGENIAKVITTMSGAIIETYDKKPEMFAQPKEGIFGKKGTSKFDLVMKSVSGLGKLMTDICKGIQGYANLNYPVKWNESGQAIAFEKMTDSDVKKAAENIALVITTMSKAIMDTYDKNPDMFKEPSAGGVMGFFGKKESSKFSKVMGTIGGLGLLMKDISTGLQAYANLQYATKWNDQGQAIAFEKMKDTDIKNAGTNIATIITTMSKAIIDTYNDNKEMFEEPSAGGLAGFFGKKDQSKFGKVMGTIGGLGILMKDISEGVQAYANLQYAVEWNKEGQAIKYKKMTDNDIKKAGENIGEVIKVMSKAIIDTYEQNPEMFEEPSASGVAGFFGKKESSKFSKVMGTIGGLGILMKDISEGLQAYANLQYPVEWNSEGQAIKFEKLGADGIKAAAENIGLVIKTMSQAIIDTYNNNPEMFEEPKASGVAGFFGKKDPSKFSKVMGTIGGLGVLLKDISTGLQSYAALKFPDTWNADGTVATYKEMSAGDFSTAATNIGIVIKTLSKAIFDTYDMNPQYFEEPESSSCWGLFKKKGKSKASKVMSAIGGLGALVSGVAQGVKDFSTMQFADQWDKDGNPTHYVPIKPADMVAASKNIGEVIKVLAQAIIDVYNASPGGMFTDQTVTTGKLFWKKVHTIEGSSPFAKVIKALGGLGELVSSVAQGVRDFASMSFADQWDKDGNPIHYQRLTPNDMKAAGVACGEVIKVLANAVIDVSKSATWSDVIKAQHCVVPMLRDLSGVIGKIAQQLKIYARKEIPLKWDKDGNVIEYTTIDFEAAAATAAQVCMTLANGMIEVAGENSWWKIQKARDVAKVVSELSGAIAPIGKGLRIFGMKQIPIAFDKDGNPTQFIEINFETAAKTAADVMATLATAMVNIYESKTTTSWGGIFHWNNFKKAEQQVVPVLKGVGASILPIAHSVKIFGMKKIPLRYDKDGNPIEFTEIDFNAAGTTAGYVLSTLANAVVDVANSNYWFDLVQAKNDVIPILNEISKLLVPLAYSLHYYGIEKIPVRWNDDGSVADSRTVDFVKAGAIAGFILNTLPEAVVKVAKDAAWYDLKQAKEDVIPTIEGISKLLAPLAYSLHYYGIEQIPVRWNKDGSVADFRTVDFVKAGAIAGFILNTLPEAVVKVAKDAAWYDLKQAKEDVIPTIEGISKLLAPLAYSLHYYGIEQIPVRWNKDGSVADFRTVDFVKAGTVAGYILTTLAEAVVKVAKGAAWYDLKQAKEDVVPTLSDLSKILAPIAGALRSYAIEEIPVAFDANGEITKTVKIDYAKAGTTAGFILNTLAEAVVKVAKGAAWYDLKQAKEDVVPTLVGITKTIAPLGKGLYLFGLDKIPVSFDANGNAVETVTVDYVQAGKNVSEILSVLTNAIVDVAKSSGWADLKQAKEDVVPTLIDITKMIAPLAKGLYHFGVDKIPVSFDANGNIVESLKIDYVQAGKNVGEILSVLANSVVDVAKSTWWADLMQAKGIVIPTINEIIKLLAPLAYSLHYFGIDELPVKWNEDGSVKESRKVDFIKAGFTAGYILETLPQAVVNVAKSAWWADLMQAKGIVIPTINDIIKLLGPLAYSLHYYGIDELPVRWNEDGSVKESRKVDFVKAGFTAGYILETLPQAVVNVAKSAWWFDLMQAKEIVIPTINDIIKLLGPLAYSLHYYGIEQLPVKWNEDGSVKESRKVNFIKAGAVAGYILETLPQAVVNVAKSAWWFDLKQAKEDVIPIIDDIRRLLIPLAKSLYQYGLEEIPIKIDDKGEILNSVKVDFVKAGKTVGNILSTIATAVVDVANSNYVYDLKQAKNDVIPIIDDIRRLLVPLAKSLYQYGIGDLPVAFAENGDVLKTVTVDFVKAGEIVGNVLSTIPSGMLAVIDKYDLAGESESIDVFFEIIDNVTRRAGKIANALYNYSISKIPMSYDENGNPTEYKEIDFNKASTIFSSIFSIIGKTMAESLELLNWEKYKNDSKVMFNSIDSYISSIAKISLALRWLGIGQAPIEFDALGNPIKFVDVDFTKGSEMADTILSSISKSLEKLFDNYNKTIKKVEEEKTIKNLIIHIKDIAKLSLLVSELTPIKNNVLTEIITYIGKNIVLLNTAFKDVSANSFIEILAKSKTLKEIITVLNATAQIVEKTPSDEFETMADGINMMNDAISRMPNQNVFEHNQKILSKYVKAINQIDIKKINSLRDLVESMNYLGYKFGNLDKFTEVLAKQMTSVLKKLSDELALASKTIKEAEKLQKQRESSIKRSIDNVKGLLGQTMKVEISQNSSGGDSSSSITNTNNGGGGDSYRSNNDNGGENYNVNLQEAGGKNGGKVNIQQGRAQATINIKQLAKSLAQELKNLE